MTMDEVARLIEKMSERIKSLEAGLENLEDRIWDVEREHKYLETTVEYLQDELADHEH